MALLRLAAMRNHGPRWYCLRGRPVQRTGKEGETTIAVQIPDVVDGEYHTIDLGVHELKAGMYFCDRADRQAE